jgi:hypothetical protein
MFDDDDVILMPNEEVQELARQYNEYANSGMTNMVVPQTMVMAE